MFKGKSGVTLISLVVTIIVLIILASISVYSGLASIKSSRYTRFQNELEIMQAQVNLLYERYQEQILNGTIIFVEDIFGNPAPYVNPNRDLSWNNELDTELGTPYVSMIVEEVKFDKKGRQKSLTRIIKLRRDDKNGRY